MGLEGINLFSITGSSELSSEDPIEDIEELLESESPIATRSLGEDSFAALDESITNPLIAQQAKPPSRTGFGELAFAENDEEPRPESVADEPKAESVAKPKSETAEAEEETTDEKEKYSTSDLLHDLEEGKSLESLKSEGKIDDKEYNLLKDMFDYIAQNQKDKPATNPSQQQAGAGNKQTIGNGKSDSLSPADKAFLDALNKQNERALKRIMIDYARLKLYQERQKWLIAKMAGDLDGIRQSIQLAKGAGSTLS